MAIEIVDSPIKNGGLFHSSVKFYQRVDHHVGYPLVNVYITMEQSTIFYGETHYFNAHFQ